MDPRELRGWSIRAVALAWPSVGVVLTMKWSLLELTAMATGVALFAVAFAAIASSRWRRETQHRDRLWAALEGAVWVKAAWLLVGLLMLPVAFAGGRGGWWIAPLFAPLILDEVTGALAISAATGITGYIYRPISLHESFFETLLTTLLQGTFIAIGLIPLGVAAFAYQRARETRTALRDPF
jgi:hypothetical protein